MNHRTVQRYTYGDPWLSLWQSAARVVAASQDSRVKEAFSTELPAHNLMRPVHLVYETVQRGPDAASAQFQTELEGVVEDCASLAAKFLWAETSGNSERSRYYSDQLKKAVCDVGGWSTCVTKYLEFKAKAGRWLYRSNVEAAFELKGEVIALIGDWGTGEPLAKNLLNEVKKLNPDVVIHLGDIYYSGTKDEVRVNFLDVCRTVFGQSSPVFTLCGNHDMYSGGEGLSFAKSLCPTLKGSLSI